MASLLVRCNLICRQFASAPPPIVIASRQKPSKNACQKPPAFRSESKRR
jgi:hypothetical protein